VVDVTNYVMLETGHPMHAFDLDTLDGREIRVRRARPGESLVTLDGVTRTLDAGMLVIADRARAVAVAGVMGGAASEVSDSTSSIAIESAWFVPGSVRATSRTLGLKTEASIRFERGADIGAPVPALMRVLDLLAQIGATHGASSVADVYPSPVARRRIQLRRARIARLLGQDVPPADTVRILTTLGFDLEADGDHWLVTVPSCRVDVLREADLIEEVARHWGFDRIPATLPALRQAPPRPSASALAEERVRRVALGAGLQEAASFTFIERIAAEPFVPPGTGLDRRRASGRKRLGKRGRNRSGRQRR
jgi:phenylalanyl-tRNA synthetase beta chain